MITIPATANAATTSALILSALSRSRAVTLKLRAHHAVFQAVRSLGMANKAMGERGQVQTSCCIMIFSRLCKCCLSVRR